MGMESVKNHPVWMNMSPVKKRIIEEAINARRSENINDTAVVIMAAMEKMKKAGESFTREETDVLIGELMKGMSASDRAKVELIKRMINNKA